MKKHAWRIAIILTIVFIAALSVYRVRQIKKDSVAVVNNIVRIHAERGVPREYAVAKRTVGVLLEPLYVQNGRALVSVSRIGKFKVGQKVHGKNAKISAVANDIDIDTGMFVIRFTEKINGTVMVEQQYDGFFIPLDAELPVGARVIARDNTRMVVLGLNDGDRVVVR